MADGATSQLQVFERATAMTSSFCRLTALNIAVLKSVQATSMSLWIIKSPPSAESRARSCSHVSRAACTRVRAVTEVEKISCFTARHRWSKTADTGVNLILLPKLQPFENESSHASVMREWRSCNLMLLHESQPHGSENETCVRGGNMELLQLEVDVPISTTRE